MSCPALKGRQEKQTEQLQGKGKKSKEIKKCSIQFLLQRTRGTPIPTGRLCDFRTALKTLFGRQRCACRHQSLAMVEYLFPPHTKNELT